MRQAFSRTFDRAYHEIHGERPSRDFEADERSPGRYYARPVHRGRSDAKDPAASFLMVWLWFVLAVVGFYLGALAVVVIGSAVVAFG